jgi:hypothetical protein
MALVNIRKKSVSFLSIFPRKFSMFAYHLHFHSFSSVRLVTRSSVPFYRPRLTSYVHCLTSLCIHSYVSDFCLPSSISRLCSLSPVLCTLSHEICPLSPIILSLFLTTVNCLSVRGSIPLFLSIVPLFPFLCSSVSCLCP